MSEDAVTIPILSFGLLMLAVACRLVVAKLAADKDDDTTPKP